MSRPREREWSFKEELEVILGFERPGKDLPNLRRLWELTLAQFVGFVITWLCNYAILGHGWALYEDQPILWALQLLVIFQAWHISGYKDEKPEEGRRILPILFVAWINWVLAFIWVIIETVNCEQLEESESNVMQQCKRVGGWK